MIFFWILVLALVAVLARRWRVQRDSRPQNQPSWGLYEIGGAAAGAAVIARHLHEQHERHQAELIGRAVAQHLGDGHQGYSNVTGHVAPSYYTHGDVNAPYNENIRWHHDAFSPQGHQHFDGGVQYDGPFEFKNRWGY